jgi:Mg-chelatase subunit ChlD
MRLALALFGAVAAAAASTMRASSVALMKRAEVETCSGLSVASNNGNRKVVIVIDSSGSMSSSDPSDLRLSAGRALNDFLVSNAEASGSVKADQVSIVDFSSSAQTVFGPGDPGDPNANKAISNIVISGGTFIAGGVLEAIEQIGKMSGETKDRSSIVVYTDGEVSAA